MSIKCNMKSFLGGPFSTVHTVELANGVHAQS